MRRGPDWRTGEEPRYRIHYGDGGTGMRRFDAMLDVGAEVRDGSRRYVVERVEQPGSMTALGHAWAAPMEGEGLTV